MIVEPEPRKILDAKYEKPDLNEVASSQDQLTAVQKKAFLNFLIRHEAAFQGKCR